MYKYNPSSSQLYTQNRFHSIAIIQRTDNFQIERDRDSNKINQTKKLKSSN